MRVTNNLKKNWADAIISKGKLIEKTFAVVFLLCILAACFVPVNYDLTVYLPDSAPTKQGLAVMEDEFGYPGTARLMLEDVSVYEAKIIKNKVEEIDGVAMVMWMDLTNDVYQSELFMNTDAITDYYKDESAAMDIIFSGGDYDKITANAIEEIQEIAGEHGRMMGSAVQADALSHNLMKEMGIAIVIAVIMALIILAITTTSWLEPVLFMAIMGIAIAINMGTNVFMGQISFLTFSLASILQLAIAMDYSVFLLHSFTWEREKGYEPKQAMANALRKSVNSILSSGATTVVGFVALLFMRFSIGADMGIVLAKGIIISLITVLVLMPALILSFYKGIEKTRHRSFLPSFDKFGKIAYKCRFGVIALVAVIIIPAFTAQNMNKFNYGNSALGAGEGTATYEDEKVINGKFGESNMMIALTPRDTGDDDYREKEFTKALTELDFVKSALSLQGVLPDGLPESFLPTGVTSLLHTENYSRVLIYVRSPIEGDYAFNCSEKVKEVLDEYYPGTGHLVSQTSATMDIKDTITKDYSLISIVSMVGVALVVMFAFKKLLLPILLIIPIMVAVFINMAVPYVAGDELMYIGYIIISCLQLGATVDYSILLANNYQDARITRAKKEAVIHAVSKSAAPILTSSSILTIVGYGLFFVSNTSAIAGMGRLIGRGAFISMLLVMFLTPSLLWMFDRFTKRPEEPFNIKRLFGKKAKPVTVSEYEEICDTVESTFDCAEESENEEKKIPSAFTSLDSPDRMVNPRFEDYEKERITTNGKDEANEKGGSEDE